jgi:hypothetical protein
MAERRFKLLQGGVEEARAEEYEKDLLSQSVLRIGPVVLHATLDAVQVEAALDIERDEAWEQVKGCNYLAIVRLLLAPDSEFTDMLHPEVMAVSRMIWRGRFGYADACNDQLRIQYSALGATDEEVTLAVSTGAYIRDKLGLPPDTLGIVDILDTSLPPRPPAGFDWSGRRP